MNETKVFLTLLLYLVLLTVCTDSLLENVNQDMANLSSINHKNNNFITNSKLYGCPENTFQCDPSHCISQDKLCDGYSDCPSNSDEELPNCFSDSDKIVESLRLRREDLCSFFCDSGKCLDSSFMCDGLKDCVDGSDETERSCASLKCPPFLFRCKYGACIPKENVCDGEANCADGSDEDTFECVKNRSLGFCNNYEFRCMDGDCIDKLDACDGFKNCADGSDETQEICAGILCPNYLFKCRYGVCVEKSARCNYIKDCVDGSDEIDCNFDSTEVFDNESSGCFLPQHPAHGKYEITQMKTYLEGMYVSSGTSLNLKCLDGYVSFTIGFTCSRNAWNPSLDQGSCLRKCSPLDLSAAYTVYCSLNKERVNCSNSVEGTIARVNCRSDYVTTTEVTSTLLCLSNGSWSQALKPCTTKELAANCILPPHPLHGKFMLPDGNYYQENATMSSVQIMVVCDQGYVHLFNHWFYYFGYRKVSKDLQFLQCDNGQWSPKPEKIACLSTCPTLHETASYEVECELEGWNVPCVNPVDNTKATLNCKPFYNSNFVNEILFCQEGMWDPRPTQCQPECGQKNVNVETLIIGGSDTMVGEYPWVVAVYNTFKANLPICSGSIISRYYVLSAAHCFTDDEGNPHSEDFFTIVAGKYYRNFSLPENDTQIRKIKNLFVHVDYKGMLDSHRDDIALIEVDQFELTLKVQLVCVDWKEKLHYLPENTKTVVTGWGSTKETFTAPEVLKKLVVPIRTMQTCQKFLEKKFFKEYYTTNKICAGFNGLNKSICHGDSGGGLYFLSDQAKYFIMGIASLTPQATVGCNSNHYALYTSVAKYMRWLTDTTLRKL